MKEKQITVAFSGTQCSQNEQQLIPAGFRKTEVGTIPEDWHVAKLGAATSFINGRAYALHEWEKSGTPVIRLQNLTGRGDEFYYSNLSLPEKQYCDYGDLLFMWSASFGPYIWSGTKAIYHYHIWKIQANSGYNKMYLYYMLDDMTERLKSGSSSGGTMLHVTKGKMESTLAAFPSIDEQTAIANALSDVDALIQELEKLIAKKQAIKTATMQQLLTGRTRLPQFAYRADGSKKGYKQSELGEIPEDWEILVLGDICDFENGDRSSNYPAANEFSAVGMPFINAGHVSEGEINLRKMDYIPRHVYDRLGGGKVISGDLVYCLRGSLGKFGVISEDFGLGAVASSLVIVRPNKLKTSTNYLAAYFQSEISKKMITLWAGGAAQPNLGAKELAKFLIPISTIHEQDSIALFISDMEAEILALEQRLAKTRQIKQGMMQELLTGRTRLVKPELVLGRD